MYSWNRAGYNYPVDIPFLADRSVMIAISKISARFGTLVIAAGVCIALAAPAFADKTGMMPPLGASTETGTPPQFDVGDQTATHPILRLTPEKSEIVRLNENATSIIVGNPQHLNVLLESPRTIILTPRQPGATHFLVMNEDGKVVMSRHVIIASPKENYVRIRRSCINARSDCQDTRVYYCPGGMCHETAIVPGSSINTPQISVSSERSGNNGNDSDMSDPDADPCDVNPAECIGDDSLDNQGNDADNPSDDAADTGDNTDL
ncbi:MAG: pilus assembly protein N-terminal domain-containing protein [Alphaproteobacteria bacterium]|nr:pilus assembly protein N-terminal domain-containing protein [Alphaproteobacteria bacterium]